MTYAFQKAEIGLQLLKEDVIGLVKNQGRFDLIVYKHSEEQIDTVTITQFGALHDNFRFPTSYGEVRYFPKGKRMNEMLENPFEWQAFINQFN